LIISYIIPTCSRLTNASTDELALMLTGSLAPAGKVINRRSEAVEEPDEGDEEPETETDYDKNEHASLAPSLEPSESRNSALNSLSDAADIPVATSSSSSIHPNLRLPAFTGLPQPLFSIDQLGADRRLLVNRKKQLKMYRVWMQGKFRKLAGSDSEA
jgi:tRNAThr (cytosine32-N3)-methyltransferase